MRISVCEFLRTQTGTNWFYVGPGHWMSDSHGAEAFRAESDPDVFYLKKGKRTYRTVAYFEGLPSGEVRKAFRRTR